MKCLAIANHSVCRLTAPLFTVGAGLGAFDACVESDEMGILFSMRFPADGRSLIFATGESIRVNGSRIQQETPLNDCDVLTWARGKAVFLANSTGVSEGISEAVSTHKSSTMTVLKDIYRSYDSMGTVDERWNRVLIQLIAHSGAQQGAIVTNLRSQAEWETVAQSGFECMGLKTVLSSSVLNETLRTREPLVVESIIGHPLASKDSVVSSKVFSVACLPLIVHQEVLGCVYLATTTAGHSIRLNDPDILGSCLGPIATSLESFFERPRKSNDTVSKKLTYFEGNPPSKMVRVMERVKRLSEADVSIVIHGETGTGKELVARAIHDQSKRRGGPFIALNCGAIPSSLIESTLFGYVKGAFTGAARDTKGKIEQANDGTLFLDEIAELPLDLQTRLLRVLQEKIVEPVGSVVSRSVDFRVVSATHQDLASAVERGVFRKDLFYRICGAEIVIPALRERICDIPLLASTFLKSKTLSHAATKLLNSYDWPGNVRELEHSIARAEALAVGDVIEPDDLELIIKTGKALSKNSGSLESVDGEFKRKHLEKVLNEVGGNRRLASQRLGISERTLYRLLSNTSEATNTTDMPVRSS